MTTLRLKWIHRFRDRHGKWRHYFRHPRLKQVPLPGEPGSPEFMQAYHQALAGGEPERRIAHRAPGSIAAVVQLYLSSLDFVSLGSEATKRTYRRALEQIVREHGEKPLRQLQAHHIESIMVSKISTPAAANNFLRYIKLLCKFAKKRKLITELPTDDVQKIKYDSDGFHTWSEEEIEQFQNFWPVGTTQRLAVDLLLYTGQRSADVRQMRMDSITEDAVAVNAEFPESAGFKQKKTKAKVDIPITPELAASLATVRGREGIILLTKQGRPFSEKGFSNYITKAAGTAGLVRCSAHGLRKSAATRLAEAGCTEAEIMAITGHKTSREVTRYVKAARQKLLAQEAMGKLSRTRARRIG